MCLWRPGVANCYFRLPGLSEDKCTVEDPEGSGKWHGYCPGSFQFDHVKNGDGDGKIKLKQTKIFSDSSPALRVMLKEGMIGAEELKGIVMGS